MSVFKQRCFEFVFGYVHLKVMDKEDDWNSRPELLLESFAPSGAKVGFEIED